MHTAIQHHVNLQPMKLKSSWLKSGIDKED